MVFDPPLRISLTIALHVAVLTVLTVGAVLLLATTHYYATALVLAAVAAMTVASLRTTIARLERPVLQMMNDMLAGAPDIPTWGSNEVRTVAAALQAERRSQATRVEYLQALVDSMATALFAVLPDGSISLTNRAAHLLTGEDAPTLPTVAAIGVSAAQQLMALPSGARKIVKLANGQQFLASIALFTLPGEEPIRLIALQSIVGELDAVELKAWQDMARILAHEMMNSLTPITSLSESLLSRLKTNASGGRIADDEVADAVEIIGRRSQGLMDFVEHYRAFAELPPPKFSCIPAAQLVAGVDGLMRTIMAEKHVDYRSRVEPADAVLHVDPQLLEQAIINLLKNAIEAVVNTPHPAITLSCRREGSCVAITVTDNGVGLTAEQIETIFVPFFTTKPRGSGIGLSLARQIAAAHGGQIEVRSTPTDGTIFRIDLQP
jgi:nitrogen fixation/metabolism regulation signal transduction histidine kinase